MTDPKYITPEIAKVIEGAILLGTIKDLDDVLTRYRDQMPSKVCSGLESLKQFRAQYAQTAPEAEIEKKKFALVDSAWAMEILDLVQDFVEPEAKAHRA